jgi:hypothetical protein
MQKYSKLETAVKARFKQLETEFYKKLVENELQVILRSGAWVNNNGIGVGWLSCSYGNPSKESLELTADIKIDKENTFLDFGIYWTDGGFVEELGCFDVGSSDNFEKLIGEIEKSMDKIHEVGLSRYYLHLIENIDKI